MVMCAFGLFVCVLLCACEKHGRRSRFAYQNRVKKKRRDPNWNWLNKGFIWCDAKCVFIQQHDHVVLGDHQQFGISYFIHMCLKQIRILCTIFYLAQKFLINYQTHKQPVCDTVGSGCIIFHWMRCGSNYIIYVHACYFTIHVCGCIENKFQVKWWQYTTIHMCVLRRCSVGPSHGFFLALASLLSTPK